MFSQSDVQGVLQAISSSQKLLPREKPFIRSASGSRLFSQQHVKDSLRELINNGNGRIMSAEAAKLLDVDQKLLLHNLPEDEGNGWGVYAQQIITTKEFMRLLGILQTQLEDSIVQVRKFCKQNDISSDLFGKLVRYQQSGDCTLLWHWEGTDQSAVYGQAFYDRIEEKLVARLNNQAGPIELKTLAEEYDLPEPFTARVASTLVKENKVEGAIQGSMFTPESYNVARQKETLERLVERGFIGVKDMKRAGIDKPEEYVKQHVEARLLKSNLVTENFINGAFDRARDALEREGFCEIQGTGLAADEEAELRKLFRSNYKGKLSEYDDCLATPALVQRISQMAISFVTNQADENLQGQIKKGQQTVDKSVNWNTLHQFISSELPIVPNQAISAIVKSMHSKIVSAYTKELDALCTGHNAAVKHQFIDRTLSRFEVHKQAIVELTDRGLAEKLGSDLLDYYKEPFKEGLETLRKGLVDEPVHIQAVQQARATVGEIEEDPTHKAEAKLIKISETLSKMILEIGYQWPTADYEDSKRSDMVLELRKQAEKTTDNSLLLLVTILVMHARIGKGVLRASGKYVPKLLKLLKGKVGDDVFSLLTKAKDSIVGKAELTSDDVDRVRHISIA